MKPFMYIKRASARVMILLALTFASIVVVPGAHAVPGFDSTIDPNVFPMLDSFKSLPLSTLNENDAKVTAINNSADSAEQQEALAAAGYPGTREYLSNTKYIGGVRDAYLAAHSAGEVPLVDHLLAQKYYQDAGHMNLDGQGEWVTSDTAKERYNYQRPVCRLGTNVIHNYSNQSCPSLSFPSGHTRLAFLEGVSLAIMLPEVAPQIMARSAEIANYRSVLGVHYPLDIMGGRALATRMVAYRLHDDTWRAKFDAAKTQLRNAIEARCGKTIAACYATKPVSNSGDTMSTANALGYERDKLTYGFTRIGTAGQSLQAPDYSYELLAAAYPNKSQTEINSILTSSAIDSGYPLDTTGTSIGTASIGWTRIDIAKALKIASGQLFTDVDASSSFFTEMNWLGSQGIATGTPINTTNAMTQAFNPYQNVTRDVMAEWIYRQAGSPTVMLPATSPFTDVSPSHPDYKAIVWMAQQGISTGWVTANGAEYRPGLAITRDAMSAFLYRYAGSPAFTPPATSPFIDVSTTQPFYKEMSWLASTGISTGWTVPNGKEYRPYNNITRDAMAAFLYRYHNL